MHAVLLSPLPFEDPDRVMVPWLNNQREDIQRDVTSYPTFRDWSQAESFDAVAAHAWQVGNLIGEGDSEEVRGTAVSSGFFDVLRVRPALGRAIGPDDTEFGVTPVIVLSQGCGAAGSARTRL